MEKTLEIHLAEQREQIAKDVEIYMNHYFDDFSIAITPILIRIVLGQKA